MISRSSRFIVTFFICLVLIGSGCKSKKKAMEAKNAAERARLEQEAADKKKRDEEESRKREEERVRAEAEAEANRKATSMAPAAKLDQFFNAVASSGNVASANSSISEALSMFSSPQTPVLIVIAEEGGMKDYDKPTTIQDYLNYLKDQKKNLNAITDIKFDSAGKITEVELTRKK